MNNISYSNKTLKVEQVKVKDIVLKVPTPFYCYSSLEIEDNYRKFSKYDSELDLLICFALKANSNVAILEILANMGAGADCVSSGEIRRALNAGIIHNKIVFSGVGKTASEIEFAIEKDILQFNVESKEELLLIDKIAQKLAKIPKVAIRINPDIDALTHSNITTGTKDDKFGIENCQIFDIFKLASELNNIKLVGVSIHIGSQITKLAPFLKSFDLIIDLVDKLILDGYQINTIDLGGGIGVKYQELDQIISIDDYMGSLIAKFAKFNCKIIIEPGRSIIASAGILVSSVLYQKNTSNKNFLIIDAGMNNLMRPSLYQAYHGIISLDEKEATHQFDVVGPICESSDIFAKQRLLPNLQSGEKIAILDVGAYGAVMSSNYNSRMDYNEVLVKDHEIYLIKEIVTEEKASEKYLEKIS